MQGSVCLLPSSSEQGRDPRGRDCTGVNSEAPSASPRSCEPSPVLEATGHAQGSGGGRRGMVDRGPSRGERETLRSRRLRDSWTSEGRADSVDPARGPATASLKPHFPEGKLRGRAHPRTTRLRRHTARAGRGGLGRGRRRGGAAEPRPDPSAQSRQRSQLRPDRAQTAGPTTPQGSKSPGGDWGR